MKKVNIIIGRFQPITLGHIKIVDAMYKENGLPTVICQVSNKKFDTKHPFSDELISEEVKIIEKNYNVVGQVYVTNADIVKCGNLLHENGFEPILWGCGTDRYASYTKQADKYKKDANLLDEFTTFEVKRSDEDISATKVREALISGDFETFKKMMPNGTDKLFDKMKEAMESIKENRSWISLSEYLSNEKFHKMI